MPGIIGSPNMDLPTHNRIIADVVAKVRPDLLNKMNDNKGAFAGGPIVCWNNQVVTPADFYIEYYFLLARDDLSCTSQQWGKTPGRPGPNLKPRFWRLRQLHPRRLNAYHVSYWANSSVGGMRGTSNLRRTSLFQYRQRRDLTSATWMVASLQLQPMKIGVLKQPITFASMLMTDTCSRRRSAQQIFAMTAKCCLGKKR